MVEVLPTLMDKRGVPVGKTRTVTFTVRGERTVLPTFMQEENGIVTATFAVEKGKECKLSFALKGDNTKGIRFLVTSPDVQGSILTTAPIKGVCVLTVPDKWIREDGTVSLRIAPKKAKGGFSMHFPLDTIGEVSPLLSPVGGYAEEVRILPMGEVKMARCGVVALVLPTGFRATLNDFLPIRSRADIGRSFRISFECRCENDRMIQARATERFGSEEYYDFFNEAALLEPMSSERFTSYSYDYTVDSLDNVKREHRKNSLVFLATSNGIRREEFCLRNIRIEEIINEGRVELDTIRISI